MANNSPTIVAASLDDEKLKASIEKMVQNLNAGLEKMKNSTDSAVEHMQKSLKKLGNTNIDMGGSADGGASRRAKAQNEETESLQKTTAARREYKATLDQTAQATQSAAAAGNKYSDEIIKQAQAIREMKQWQEKGFVSVGNNNFYNPETSIAPLKTRKSLEEQIFIAMQKQTEAAAQNKNAQAEVVKEEKLTEEQIRRNIAEAKRLESVLSGKKDTTTGGKTTFQRYDDLRQSIAAVLGITEKQVKMADSENSSYTRLSATLKQLRMAYDKLSSADRNSEQGKALVASMHEIERSMQKINNQASRPVNLRAALGLDEKTLDDITYKLQRLQSYKRGIDLGTSKGVNEMKQVELEVDRLKKRYDELMGKNSSLIASNNALGRSWTYMKNRLAFYFTVGASTQFVRNLIEIRSQYEMNERALGILIDSAERGSRIFNELSQMALVSPYTLIELSSAAKQLTAYDIAAKDVVDTTRRLADMASAVGVPMERLTYALGQIKAYGYLNSRDARMFANAGIPLVRELSKYYTELEGRLVSVGDVYDRMKRKAIGFEEVVDVINKMTDEGGKFYDFQAKMAETLKVQLANLTLAWNNMLNDIGESQQGILSGGIQGLKELFLHWRDIESILTNVAIAFGSVKAAQILLTLAYGKGTMAALKTVAAREGATAADYKNAIATENLTKAKARFLVITNANNKALIAAIANTKILTAAEIEALVSTSKLGTVGKAAFTGIQVASEGAARGVKVLASSLASVAPMLLSMLALSAAVDAGMKIYSRAVGDTKTADINRQVAENAKSSAEAISKTLSSLQEVYRENNVTSALELKAEDQKKAWAEVREQIELSAASANKFIEILLQKDNMGERVQQAEKYLQEIGKIHALMALWKDDTLKVSDDFKILGIGADGLTEDLKDFTKAMNNAKLGTEELRDASSGIEGEWRAIYSWVIDLNKILNYATPFNAVEGWFADAAGNILGGKNQQELFDKNKLVDAYIEVNDEIRPLAKNLMKQLEDDGVTSAAGIQEAMTKALATIAEQEKWNDEQRLNARILLEQQMRTNGNAIFAKALEDRQASWDAWMKFLLAHHKTEFSKMGKEEVSQEKWAQDRRKKLYEDTYKKFQEYNRLAADDIKGTVNDLSQLQVHIKVFYDDQEAEKSVYKTLEEFDKQADDSWKTMQRLNTRIRQLQDEGVKEISSGEEYSLASKKEKELANAIAERTAAQNMYNEAVANGGHSKKEEAAGSKAQKQAESELQQALKEELQLIDKVRSSYKTLTEAGVGHYDAITASTEGFSESVNNINRVLSKYGLQELNLSKFAGVTNPRELVEMLQSQINALLKSGVAKPAEIQDLQVKIRDLKLDVEKFDQQTITDSLNSSLGRLKEEYELAVSLDADPELGSTFADMMGIDVSTLPHTVEEYADEYTKLLNKFLNEKKVDLILPHLNLTDDDLRAFEQMAKEKKITEEAYKVISDAVKDVREKKKKDIDETVKEFNALVGKYGDIQSRLTKIYKDSINEQLTVIKSFGNEAQKSVALDLVRMIQVSKDPSEIARLQKQFTDVLNDVTGKNEAARKMSVSISNKGKNEAGKAFWEDFKNSDMYTMTFEDMSKNSTVAIEKIIEKLNMMKDKVKEDPASMKALIKSLEDAESELRSRDPFRGIIQSLKDLRDASNEAKTAQEELDASNSKVEGATIALKNAQAIGDQDEIAKSQERLNQALDEQEEKEKKLIAAENKRKKSIENLKASASNLADSLNDIKGAFDAVSKVFRDFGDDNTADAIDEISQGFTIMVDVIMAVIAAMALLYMEMPWLLAISAALAVIVGLTKFLSGQNNKKIDKHIKESELAVKRLENAYKDLQYEIEKAYGSAKIGAQQAAIANKELQLAELKRQLQLEQSRKKKDRDESRILDIKGQIKDLEIELKKSVEDITNDILGISSVGNAAESLVSSMIEAFKNGEDYMLKFDESFEKMIDNMIMKSIVSSVIGERIQQVWDMVDERVKKRTAGEQSIIKYITEAIEKIEEDIEPYERMIASGSIYTLTESKIRKEYDALIKQKEALQRQLDAAKAAYSAAARITPEDVAYTQGMVEGFRDDVKSEMEAWMKAFGITFGQDAESSSLSALQQGIQSVTEQTAGALEAITNGMYQQITLQSDILQQINTTLQTFNLDVQLGTLSEILLQLQSSYQTQNAIRSIMEGWSSANGMSVRVEMV